MCRLNAHQARHIEATFASVETILQSIEKVARPELSPFAKERADLAPEEMRLIQSFVALIRARMVGALDRLRIPRPEQKISARWSASTSLTFADIALSGLTPSDLAGYGSVDTESAEVLEALAVCHTSGATLRTAKTRSVVARVLTGATALATSHRCPTCVPRARRRRSTSSWPA